MSRQQYDTRSQAAPRDPSGRRRRTGTWFGPVRITPARVTLVIALAGGIGFLLWSVLVRDKLQVPLMATGFAICGIVFAATALLSVAAVVRAGHEGRDGAAVLTALLGGVVAVMALMSLAAAVIMSLIWSGTKGS
jgi:uncharacterized membrane protein YadS